MRMLLTALMACLLAAPACGGEPATDVLVLKSGKTIQVKPTMIMADWLLQLHYDCTIPVTMANHLELEAEADDIMLAATITANKSGAKKVAVFAHEPPANPPSPKAAALHVTTFSQQPDGTWTQVGPAKTNSPKY